MLLEVAGRYESAGPPLGAPRLTPSTLAVGVGDVRDFELDNKMLTYRNDYKTRVLD